MPISPIVKNKTIILFTLQDCGPCRQYKPVFTEVSQMPEFFDVDFQTLDATKDSQFANACGVMSAPATVFVDNGQPVSMYPGFIDKETLINRIRMAFYGQK